MPSKSYRQQVRMSPETRCQLAELATLWAGSDGVPLTPSAVVRLCVERAYAREAMMEPPIQSHWAKAGR